MNAEKINSKIFYVMRGFAIISVACAHAQVNNPVLSKVFGIFGTVGVPIFLIASGMYIDLDKEPLVFIKNKFKKLIIPLLICGGMTYIYKYIQTRDYTILGYIKWISGYNTWLYFSLVLFICSICLKYWHSKASYCYYLIIFILSNYLTITDKIPYSHITKYQNVFNWLGFFVIGVIMKEKEIKKLKLDLNLSHLLVATALFVVLTVYYYLLVDKPSYWNYFSIVYELLSFVIIYIISYFLYEFSIFAKLGRNSYFLFFFHMQVGSIFSDLLSYDYLEIFKPLVSVLSIYVILIIGRKIAKYLKIDRYLWLVGAYL